LKIGDSPALLGGGIFGGAVAIGGAAGVGATVIVIVADPVTKAHITNSTTDALGTTEVRAESSETISALGVAGAGGVVVGVGGGIVGLQGSIAVINIGSSFSSDGRDNLPSQGESQDDSLSNMGSKANEQANGSTGTKVGTLAGSDPTATGATSKADAS